MGILSWIIFGLIAGILAKWIMPGEDGGGFIMTIILGIIGALVGGYISTFFGMGRVDGFNLGSFVVASNRLTGCSVYLSEVKKLVPETKKPVLEIKQLAPAAVSGNDLTSQTVIN